LEARSGIAVLRLEPSLPFADRIGDIANMEDFIVAQYLWEQRPDGRYVPMVRVQVPRHQRQTESIIITDPDGRTYRDLNRALEMDHWLLNRWRRKHAPKSEVVITPMFGINGKPAGPA
jgi:hypothetical protein